MKTIPGTGCTKNRFNTPMAKTMIPNIPFTKTEAFIFKFILLFYNCWLFYEISFMMHKKLVFLSC